MSQNIVQRGALRGWAFKAHRKPRVSTQMMTALHCEIQSRLRHSKLEQRGPTIHPPPPSDLA
eukprot:14372581-Alexandrium_andersonii.AAC.1